MSKKNLGNVQNVYDIRYEKNLYHIFETTECEYSSISGKTAVVISLFYLDTYKRYIRYINEIVEDIDVYVVSPNEELLALVGLETDRNVMTIKKENRGRDISALLIASKHVFQTYDYVCFVHDKKEKFDEQAEDSRFWIYNMWENTLSSKGYVYRILKFFEDNRNLGLLLPPEPIGNYINCWYINKWSSNYANTVQLCAKLDVEANLNENIPPIAFGTVFWCRTEAIRKLTDYPWKYEDFKDEPLRFDGEINHAVERALPYIAQDAGFETHMVMTTDYAVQLMSKSQFIMQRAFSVLNNEMGIRYAFELSILDKKKERMRNFCSKYKEIYIYGIGERSRDALRILSLIDVQPSGFIVSEKSDDCSLMGKTVYALNDFCAREEVEYGIIIATNQINGAEIEENLRKRGIDCFIHFTENQ